jgi:tetratricopeptide (TPR) repeat protein
MRGITYGEKGDHEKAVADYTEAIRLAPDDPIGYFQRAQAYRALGDEEQAASDERKAQELTK